MNCKIGFIGAGKMVSAIVTSLIRSGSFQANEITCCSANDGTSNALSLETGIHRCEDVAELIGKNRKYRIGRIPIVTCSNGGCK